MTKLLCNTFLANNYGPLNRGMVILQFAAGSFHTKKLYSRLYSIEIELYLKKTKKSLFEPPFGRLRGNVPTPSIAS